MDVERYAAIDRELGAIRWTRRNGGMTEFGFRPRLAGLPGPTTVARMRLTPGERVDITLAPPPRNRLTRLLSDFGASFDCTPTESGTRLVRTLTFRFRPVPRRLLEPRLEPRLTADVHEEVRLAKWYLERQDRG